VKLVRYSVFEVKAIRLLRKVWYKSPVYAAQYLRNLASTHQSVPIQPNNELLRTSRNSPFKAVALSMRILSKQSITDDSTSCAYMHFILILF